MARNDLNFMTNLSPVTDVAGLFSCPSFVIDNLKLFLYIKGLI